MFIYFFAIRVFFAVCVGSHFQYVSVILKYVKHNNLHWKISFEEVGNMSASFVLTK